MRGLKRLFRKFIEAPVEVEKYVIYFILLPAGIGVKRPGLDALT